MKATIASTDQIVTVNGVPARVWVGTTERGVPFHALITRVAVDTALGEDAQRQFAEELLAVDAPRPELPAWPTRMIL